MKKRVTLIKEHFESAAEKFDSMFSKIAPFYKEAIGALVLALPFQDGAKPKIIDLGCGTGNITKAVKRRYPHARVICLDLAENMIEMAKAKLERYKNIDYWCGDIRGYNYSCAPAAIISSLALHHLDTKNKKSFYRRIYNALPKDGVFYIADVVLSPNSYLSKAYIEQWKKFMLKNITREQVNNVLKNHKEQDKPAELLSEIDLLRKTGFREIDVIWKKYNFAVYGGIK
ncbi:MAG: methyltransferase domain-containing protein [bacterium]|nr:methyltransferase domain-containing protein [bacterium]